MKLLIAVILVAFSQLLGADVYATQRADSGKVYCLQRQAERPHATPKGVVINKVGFIHHLCHPVRVEDENEENLYKKLSTTGSLLFLSSTAPSCHCYSFVSDSPSFFQPVSGAGASRYILHRVLRI